MNNQSASTLDESPNEEDHGLARSGQSLAIADERAFVSCLLADHRTR